MYLKLFILLAMTSLAHAATPEQSAKEFVQKKHFQGAETMLTVIEDKSITFSRAHLYRVRPLKSKGGWTVLVLESGESVEADKSSLSAFLKSIEKGLAKVTISDPKDMVKVSNGLLNHLSTSQRSVKCSEKKCELEFTEGEFAGQKASLAVDAKAGSIKVEK